MASALPEAPEAQQQQPSPAAPPPQPWYAAIAHLCLPYVSLPLSREDLAYLSSDETRLPAPAPGAALLPGDPRAALDGELFAPAREALERGLAGALRALGGAALPRACGVAPWDAGWAAQRAGFGECLRCSSVGEVWALLMASERVHRAAAAAAAAPAAAAPPCLVLWQWLPELRSEGEVRCVLRGGALAHAARRQGGSAALPPALRATVEAFVAAHDWRAAAGGAAPPGADLALDLYVPLGSAGGGGAGVVVLDLAPLACDPAPLSDAGGGGGAPPPPPAPGGLHFHPWAAHAFPDELFHYAAERVAAGTVGRAGGGLEGGSAAGGLVSALAQQHGEEQGLGGGAGWAALVEALHARGEFVRGGAEEEEEEEEKEGAAEAAAAAK
jgi:hypothetical protein